MADEVKDEKQNENLSTKKTKNEDGKTIQGQSTGDPTIIQGKPGASDKDLLVNDDFVIIGCRLPNGVEVKTGQNKITLRGVNAMPNQIKCSGIGYTKVKISLWDEFTKTHKDWPPLQNDAVFVSDNKDIWWDK